MGRLTDRTEEGLICLNNNGNCRFIEQLIKAIGKLAEFEDFVEEQGFESLKELEKFFNRYKHCYSLSLNLAARKNPRREFYVAELMQLIEYKARWDALKKFVNMPKEIQQWDERFEVTVDSIKAKMQELEEKWSTY